MLAVSVLSFILTLSFFLKAVRRKKIVAALIIIILLINIANNLKGGPFTSSSAPYQKFKSVKLSSEFLKKIGEIKISESIGIDNRSALFLWNYKNLRINNPERDGIPMEKYIVYCVYDNEEKTSVFYKNLTASGIYKNYYSDSQFEILKKTE